MRVGVRTLRNEKVLSMVSIEAVCANKLWPMTLGAPIFTFTGPSANVIVTELGGC